MSQRRTYPQGRGRARKKQNHYLLLFLQICHPCIKRYIQRKETKDFFNKKRLRMKQSPHYEDQRSKRDSLCSPTFSVTFPIWRWHNKRHRHRRNPVIAQGEYEAVFPPLFYKRKKDGHLMMETDTSQRRDRSLFFFCHLDTTPCLAKNVNSSHEIWFKTVCS